MQSYITSNSPFIVSGNSPFKYVETICQTPTVQESTYLRKRDLSRFSFRNSRNIASATQSILVALLNIKFKIVLKSPLKKAKVTQQLLRIESIEKDNTSLFIEDFVQTRCINRLTFDKEMGVSSKTAGRRAEYNKLTENIHLLMDVLREDGFFFETETTKGKRGTLKMETIKKIYWNGRLFLDKDDIWERGSRINQYINSVFEYQDILCLGEMDRVIQRMY
ncbi:hypothetical protein EIN_485740 [Entamoeba invadens IP1]|uniref:Uncharacterized protein n=1 Tax=Entamoeba invadens IP1 TaxID=370355 RepID=A0A0A1U4J5_ENTIV|nr:hypothetical protein EIN_485740 [Entamoeba invadens IP1]ELP89182.1 hypothetical protein EIN_485740 [Entamoeba invadens IP1]|eukprot:XP_004255953.1 hypothetical protein EIN_485740 [Entamoeba invadens IP1]